jgi:hypothetical protein
MLPRRYSIGIEFTSRKVRDFSLMLQKGCLQACGQLRQLVMVVPPGWGCAMDKATRGPNTSLCDFNHLEADPESGLGSHG